MVSLRRDIITPRSFVRAALIKAALEKRMRRDAERYVDDPVGYITDRLGATIWSKQQEIARSVAAHRHTAVRSCHGVGKSYIAARIAVWWVSTRPPGEAMAITTAPTNAQVRAILWREMRRAHVSGNLPGRMNQHEWYLPVKGVDELVAFGRKPGDYDEAAFQGIHARYVLVVLDEAAGVPAQLWAAAETIVTNEDSRVLAIGNPDDPSSHFAQVCRPGSLWNTIHVDAFDSPNFTDEPFPDDLRPNLVSQLWVEERQREWGEASPLYESRVRGNFPENPEDAVVLMSWALACRHADPEDRPAPLADDMKVLGVDVGAGGDETALVLRHGPRAYMEADWHRRTPDSEQAAGMVMQVLNDSWTDLPEGVKGIQRIHVDENGVGFGVVGLLRVLIRQSELLSDKGIYVVGVQVSSKSRYRHFRNLRDELWWHVGRENSRLKQWDLTDVPESVIGQLIAPKYDLDSAGNTRVEPKDDTKKRLGRSPDHADALLLAFYRAPTAAESIRV